LKDPKNLILGKVFVPPLRLSKKVARSSRKLTMKGLTAVTSLGAAFGRRRKSSPKKQA